MTLAPGSWHRSIDLFSTSSNGWCTPESRHRSHLLSHRFLLARPEQRTCLHGPGWASHASRRRYIAAPTQGWTPSRSQIPGLRGPHRPSGPFTTLPRPHPPPYHRGQIHEMAGGLSPVRHHYSGGRKDVHQWLGFTFRHPQPSSFRAEAPNLSPSCGRR